MNEPDIQHEMDGKVAIIRLARAPHNYFDAAMIGALADLVEKFDADPGVRACLLTSAQKHFCAGADFSGGKRIDPAPIYRAAIRLAAHRKPLVAAIRGAAIGGGLGLALTADMRVGARDCRFEANFTRIALSPGFGITYALPRLVGAQKARDMLLTGRRIGGEEALAIGLVDRLAEPDALEADALALARELATNSPAAMAATRKLMAAQDDRPDFAATIEKELAAQYVLFESPDFGEGVEAARERREPRFMDFAETNT